MTIHHQAHTRQTAVHLIIQVAVMENGMQYSSFYGDSLRRLKKNKMAMFCACVLILLALMAIFAPLLAPYDPTYQDYSAVLGGPCKAHPFGTDEFGRDILSRIIYGSRVSISIGIVALIILPHDGVGGWIPMPKKLKDASYMIAFGIPRVTRTIMVDRQFGTSSFMMTQ